jgi:AbrB family looped-hinge helix DNA binding protein
MPSVVGSKGQIVIEKGIRDQLGIGPGYRAIQTRVGDKVEIWFAPPRHRDSVFAVFRDQILARGDKGDWLGRRDEIWSEAVARGDKKLHERRPTSRPKSRQGRRRSG